MKIKEAQLAWNERLTIIEKELDKILPNQCDSSWISQTGGEDLESLPPHQADIFNAPARDLVKRGGKRWRAILMMLSAEIAGNGESVIPFTPIVELPHNGSLIIDDIEDHSDFRRDKPAVHLLYGEDISINAGNLIYYLPTFLIEEHAKSSEQKARMYEIYSRCMRRLHMGQGLDIQWHKEASLIPDQKAYLTMCKLKTGSLSRMAAELGFAATQADAQKGALLAEIAEHIGIGFQIADDITNLRTGNPGKKRGDDIVEMKKSLPVILFANQNNPKPLITLMKEASRLGIDLGNHQVQQAIEILEKTDAINQAAEIAHTLMQKTSLALETSFPSCEATEIIQFMINSFKIP